MRTLTSAALHGAIVVLAALAALRASDPVLTVAVVALVAVLMTWFAALPAEDDASRIGETGTLAGLTLAIVGRSPWGNLLPVLAVQAVVAVAIGAAANALADQLGPTLVIGEPSLAVAAIAATLAGLTAAWVTLAIDGTAPVALAGVPAVVAGGTGPIALVVVFHPAATLGLATAGLLPWDVAAVAVAASTAAAVIGTYAISALLPAAE
ncbi:hypothetical protein [Aeromicrobium sp.]|uniref:hypothetical protein n=1 Tax=Aeromicrobium sp. TaxID=1871063 RepID=UPI0025C399A4|nr:hypothetical protein [Aeromicrobium sp.]MCK5891190.1 hypothetical protein [Aeromicrobium sp.]